MLMTLIMISNMTVTISKDTSSIYLMTSNMPSTTKDITLTDISEATMILDTPIRSMRKPLLSPLLLTIRNQLRRNPRSQNCTEPSTMATVMSTRLTLLITLRLTSSNSTLENILIMMILKLLM